MVLRPRNQMCAPSKSYRPHLSMFWHRRRILLGPRVAFRVSAGDEIGKGFVGRTVDVSMDAPREVSVGPLLDRREIASVFESPASPSRKKAPS
jgi:hypothetical protein